MAVPGTPLVLGLAFLAGLGAGVYAVLLWHKLTRLEGKLDVLQTNCVNHHKDLESRFLTRLEHEVEHQGLWEALHHHEHDFRGRLRR